MIFHAGRLSGVFLVEPEPRTDERGAFVTTFSEEEFRAHGLATHVAFCATARNTRRGTLRGMHYQAPPFEQAKLVCCTRGRIHDVIVDLRDGSPTRRRWEAFDLVAPSNLWLYIPPGLAHGYLTLEAESEVFYQISAPYVPGSERGVRWDDPALGIDWPFAPQVLSERDRSFAPLTAAAR